MEIENMTGKKEEPTLGEVKPTAGEMKKTKLLQGDFSIRGKEIPDNSIDCILTDPPYSKDYLFLWERLSLLASRVLKPSGFLITYTGKLFLPLVIRNLSRHLEWYWMFSLIHKGESRYLDFVNLCGKYKPVLIYYKSPLKKIINKPSNERAYYDVIVNEIREKDLHEWQQGIDGVGKFIKIFTKPDDLVLDPMMGSGTTIIACRELGRRAIGIEKKKETFEISKARIIKYVEENGL